MKWQKTLPALPTGGVLCTDFRGNEIRNEPRNHLLLCFLNEKEWASRWYHYTSTSLLKTQIHKSFAKSHSFSQLGLALEWDFTSKADFRKND